MSFGASVDGGLTRLGGGQPSSKRPRYLENQLGVVGVELAKSGQGHCAWCDTRIQQGTPRVIKRQYTELMVLSRGIGGTRRRHTLGTAAPLWVKSKPEWWTCTCTRSAPGLRFAYMGSRLRVAAASASRKTPGNSLRGSGGQGPGARKAPRERRGSARPVSRTCEPP